jgi:hypothetical protein
LHAAGGFISAVCDFNLDITFAVKEALLSDLEELPNLKIGDYVLQLETNDLTPEVKEIARKELRETPEVCKEAVIALRDLLRGKECFRLPDNATFEVVTKCLLIIKVSLVVTL